MSTLLIIILVVAFLFFTGIALLIGGVIWLGREKGSKGDHAKNHSDDDDHDNHHKKDGKKGAGYLHLIWIIPAAFFLLIPVMTWGLRITSPPPPKTLQWNEATWSATYYDLEGFRDTKKGDQWVQVIEISNTNFIARYKGEDGDWYYYVQRLGESNGTHYNQNTKKVVEEFWVLRGEYFPFTTKQIVLMTKLGEKIVFRAREQTLDKNMFLGEKNRPRL